MGLFGAVDNLAMPDILFVSKVAAFPAIRPEEISFCDMTPGALASCEAVREPIGFTATNDLTGAALAHNLSTYQMTEEKPNTHPEQKG